MVAPEGNEGLPASPAPRGVFRYLRAHWRGEHSLAISFWVNYTLPTALLYGIFALLGPALQRLYAVVTVTTSLSIFLALVLLLCVFSVWAWVGIWRAALASGRRTGKHLWPALAIIIVLLSIWRTVPDVYVFASDLVRLHSALSVFDLEDYAVTILDDTDLVFEGAINDRSVDAVIAALENPDVAILRIESHGGAVTPALRLARYVEDNEVFVMAEGQCASGCVVVLAASPDAAIYPGTVVSFHDPERVAELRSPKLRGNVDKLRSDVEQHFRSHGIEEWAISETRLKRYWSPSINQLIAMGLLKFIYDPEAEEFVSAELYCGEHPEECG